MSVLQLLAHKAAAGGGGGGTVTYDTSSSAHASASSVSASHTCTGTDLELIVCVTAGAGGGNVTATTIAVTYNGVSMTAVGSAVMATSTSCKIQMFKLASPATGAHTIAVTTSGGASTVNVCSYAAVSVTSCTGGTANYTSTTSNSAGTSPTLNVTSAANHFVVGFGAHGDLISGINGAWGTQRVLDNFSTSTAMSCFIMGTQPGASTIAVGFTSGFTDTWGLMGVDLVP